MNSSEPKWTDQQKTAIETLDRNVMVAASAGTGKTAVLSARCAEIVSRPNTDKGRAEVSQILVLTFTEAAADEMHSRIAQQIREAYRISGDKNLKLQLLLLDGADISTIHSFCKTIITEHFYELGIDPSFAILDSDEQMLIKAEILNDIIEQAWQDDSLRDSLEALLYRRNASTGSFGILHNIISISQYLEGLEDKTSWYEKALSLSSESNSAMPEQFVEAQKKYLKEKLQNCKEQILYAIELDELFCQGQCFKKYLVEDYIPHIDILLQLTDAGEFETLIQTIAEFSPPTLRAGIKGVEDETKKTIKIPIEDVKKQIKEFMQLAILNSEYDQLVGTTANQQTRVLIELVKRFQQQYQKKKQQLNCLDFSDLEHFALKLLSDGDNPSDTALNLQRKYKYIFVDEYQDISKVQQAILDRLTNGDNLFGVGDVKQSIYAFRQAQPEIFLAKIESAERTSENNQKGLRVDLSKNFRSRKEVLDFVNAVFKKIMRKEIATIDYDQSCELQGGDAYDDTDLPCVELNILDEAVKDDRDNSENNDGSNSSQNDLFGSINASQRQALLVGRRIREMVENSQFKIHDKQIGDCRAVEYSDIVVLMRSVKSRLNDYVEIFDLLGVPIASSGNSGYFETTEITDCLSLLKVLDNPHRDIELAAVLRSPFFKFSDTDLAEIKAWSASDTIENNDFYNCLSKYAQDGAKENLRSITVDFFKTINEWRTLARRGSLADLIWKILRQTGYLSFVRALPNGRQRRANLLKLHERAIQFEGFVSSAQAVSLGRFVDFVEKLLEQGSDWSPAEPNNSTRDGVQIMSVHKSKGLEFPVVFLAQLDTSFNTRDLRDDCLVDSDDTLGLRIINRSGKVKTDSIAHQIISEKKKKTLLAEEMRILYVALTRARERLVLCGATKLDKCRQMLSGQTAIMSKAIPAWQLAKCNNHLQWILLGLSSSKQMHNLFNISHEEQTSADELFIAKLYSRDELQEWCDQIESLKDYINKKPTFDVSPDSKTAANIKQRLNWEYPHQIATKLKAKTSVSKLSDRKTYANDDFAEADYSLAFQPSRRKTNADAGRIGTAVHLVIQKLDITKPINSDAISNTIKNLVSQNMIVEEIAAGIDADRILGFFQSDIGKIAADPASKVMREWPFTFALDASTVEQSPCNEKIIVQGIIDMIIETSDGIIVVDFKTDAVSGDALTIRAETYYQQINIYSRAASEILDQKISSKWLYFLTPGISHSVQ